uniref:Uncharacterized protein n=1 Tax=Meloidogyne floridensis TaxID=298350 RepID=A0A915PB41_9BILA
MANYDTSRDHRGRQLVPVNRLRNRPSHSQDMANYDTSRDHRGRQLVPVNRLRNRPSHSQ